MARRLWTNISNARQSHHWSSSERRIAGGTTERNAGSVLGFGQFPVPGAIEGRHVEMAVPGYPWQQPAYPVPAAPFTPPLGLILDGAIAKAVVVGWRVESHTEAQAVLVSGQRPNHLLHLVLTLCTCGFWGFVWIVVALTIRESRLVYTVDPAGQVHIARSR